MNAREIAFQALLLSLKGEKFISEALDEYLKKSPLSPLDTAFAYEIAAGSCRMALALDYMAERLTAKQKLDLKLKEKALLRTAFYQYCYMNKVPLYAIVNETAKLAKKYCFQGFSGFANAILRKLEEGIPELPQGDSPKELSIRYSYPKEYVDMLIRDYGLNTAQKVLQSGNESPQITVRVRPQADAKELDLLGIVPIAESSLAAGYVKDRSKMEAVGKSPHVYIQNITPIALLESLNQHSKQNTLHGPILDLCASPGGKSIWLHDQFLNRRLHVNDVSEEKIKRLRENFHKYGISAQITCSLGQNYPAHTKFDLIVLDVPCSNTGVLNKRPEARWRLSRKTIQELKETQRALLQRALELLSPGGEIWFLTCSILKDENEELIQEFCKNTSLEMIHSTTILPNSAGWDGGYAALLTAKVSG